MKHKNLMAKALYDNVPESPEELAFRKGDILTVIEQNTGGLEGWWLCSLHGRQGIAPGNRLKLLIGPMFENQAASQSTHFQVPATQAFLQPSYTVAVTQSGAFRDPVYQIPPALQIQQSIYQVPPGLSSHGKDVYQVPPSSHRSQWGADASPAKQVVTPTRVGQTYVYEPRFQKDVYDVPAARTQGVYDLLPASQKGPMFHSPLVDSAAHGVYDIPPTTQGVYSIPPSALQKEGNYDFPAPTTVNKPEGVYDIPPASVKSQVQSSYDFPPTNSKAIYDTPPSQLFGLQLGSQKDVYDVPRGLQTCAKQEGVYDVPPQVSLDSKGFQDLTDGINRLSFSSTGSTKSNMSTSSTTSKESTSVVMLQDNKLFLDLDSAIQRFSWLQQHVESSVLCLMEYVVPNWRSLEYMEKHINEIHVAVDKVKRVLYEFLNFSKGAAANALDLADLTLHAKMKKQLQRLEDSSQILVQTSQGLDSCSWSLNILVINKTQNKCDDLDRFFMVSKTIPDDVKQLSSLISSNAELLFKRASNSFDPASDHRAEENASVEYIYDSPQRQTETDDKTVIQSRPLLGFASTDPKSVGDHSVNSWMEDYDYVHLQGKEEFERQQKELLEKENIIKQNKIELEQEQLNRFKELEKEVIKPVENDISTWSALPNLTQTKSGLCSKDKQLLCFYSEQCETHFVTLLNATDAFFSCISTGQPPRIFVAHSKFVILSAHKLVFIGDALSRQAATLEIRNKVINHSNILCELLKTIVSATKMAALHYPSTAAVQEMVDRVTELSLQAQQFKVQLLQMASS
ncbi:enhancer of filamentation 1 isoform X1 [Erpetoichthys calabaricus]|uniref:Breast cancer anti-estrogen resistance protein 1 n=2 Tax=Erpetoichthys calabaricus TaxID=27687 RepID=A0A8C4SPI8_ERPCA|nr:enhancer of filamentation 1 isoform X1 [Erpetoichthys calabaricus]